MSPTATTLCGLAAKAVDDDTASAAPIASTAYRHRKRRGANFSANLIRASDNRTEARGNCCGAGDRGMDNWPPE